MFENKTEIVACTHNGVFHADDVTAYAILLLCVRHVHGFPTVKLVRTRDQKVIEKADIVFDVGGQFDSGNRSFDHHQRGGAGVRANGIPYASAGLVWGEFCDLLLVRAMGCEAPVDAEVSMKVDEQFIQPIDAADNGYQLADESKPIRPLTLSALVSGMNPRWDEPQTDADFTSRFYSAAALVEKSLEACILREISAQKAVEIVRRADVLNGVMLLPQFCPWQETLLNDPNFDDVKFVVYKQAGESTETWMVQCVPDKIGSFGKRKSLPASWGGLRDEALAKECGVEGAVFCHPGLFIAGAGSKVGALEMAHKAVGA